MKFLIIRFLQNTRLLDRPVFIAPTFLQRRHFSSADISPAHFSSPISPAPISPAPHFSSADISPAPTFLQRRHFSSAGDDPPNHYYRCQLCSWNAEQKKSPITMYEGGDYRETFELKF